MRHRDRPATIVVVPARLIEGALPIQEVAGPRSRVTQVAVEPGAHHGPDDGENAADAEPE